MLDPVIVSAIVALVALAIAGYALYKASQAGTPITTELVSNTLNEAATQASELAEVALTGAQAAEQLYRTGKILRSERLSHAFAYVKQWFPDLDEERILVAIEAGVLIVNTLVEDLPKVSSSVTKREN